jgi:hypothetical protein
VTLTQARLLLDRLRLVGEVTHLSGGVEDEPARLPSAEHRWRLRLQPHADRAVRGAALGEALVQLGLALEVAHVGVGHAVRGLAQQLDDVRTRVHVVGVVAQVQHVELGVQQVAWV